MLSICIINNKRKCKNKIYNYNVCLNHFKLLYFKYIIIIQKNMRGYKIRKKYNNIYKKLPIDLQHKIINYINKDYYYNKYISKLNSIILNYSYKLHYHLFNNEIFMIDDFIKIYKLYTKYYNIIPINNLKHIYIIGFYIYHYYNLLYNNGLIDIVHDIVNIPIYSKIKLEEISIEKLNYLNKLISIYIKIYKKNHEVNNSLIYL